MQDECYKCQEERGEPLVCSNYSNCTLPGLIQFCPQHVKQTQAAGMIHSSLTQHSLQCSFSPCPNNYSRAQTDGEAQTLSYSSCPILGAWGVISTPSLFFVPSDFLLSFCIGMWLRQRQLTHSNHIDVKSWEYGKALSKRKRDKPSSSFYKVKLIKTWACVIYL